MADVDHPDPGEEVDEDVAVHVFDSRTRASAGTSGTARGYLKMLLSSSCCSCRNRRASGPGSSPRTSGASGKCISAKSALTSRAL